MRATMRSAAKLSYQEAQAAIDGKPNAKTAPLLEPILRPLWQVYTALKEARDRRGPSTSIFPNARSYSTSVGLSRR